MTPDEVIAIHRKWKERFRAAMGTGERLDIAQISADTYCQFGQWLNSEGKTRFGMSNEFIKCLATHAAFHGEAGKVAQLVNQGDFLAAEKMLATGSAYAQASEALGISVKAIFASEAKA